MPPKRKRGEDASKGSKRHTTITVALRKSIRLNNRKSDKLRGAIEQAVRAITQISAEGSRFLNFILLRRLRDSLPLPTIDSTFVRRVFSRIWAEAGGWRRTRDPGRDDQHRLVIDQAWNEYSPARGDLPLASFPGGGFAQILQYAVNSYLVNARQHVRGNFYKRLFGHACRRLVELREELGNRNQKRRLRQAASTVVRWIINAVPQDGGITQEEREERSGTLLQILGVGTAGDDEEEESILNTTARIMDYVDEHVQRYAAVLPIRDHVGHRDWFNLLPWLYAIMQACENHNNMHAADDDPVRPARVFTLAPIHSFDAKFITIDTRALHMLLRRDDMGLRNEVPASWRDFQALAEGPEGWWASVFDVARVLRTGDPDFKFANTVKTDGVAIQFLCYRRTTETEVEDPAETEIDDALGESGRKKKAPWVTPLSQWPKPDEVDEKYVIGVDPGRRDFVTAAYPRPRPARQSNDPEEDEKEEDELQEMKTDDEEEEEGGEGGGGGEALHVPPSESYVPPSRRRKPHNRGPRRTNYRKRRRNESRTSKKRKRRTGGRKHLRHTKGDVAFSVSTVMWRSDAGNKRAQAQSEAWLKRTRFETQLPDGRVRRMSLFTVLQETPTPKVANTDGFLAHCRYVCTWLERILDHKVGRRKVRRLRFQGRIQRYAALDALCHRLSGGHGKRAVVVLGAATFSRGFGHFPAPIKELRRRLEQHTRVVVLHEHYTSQRCSKCAFGLTELVGEERVDDVLEPGKCGQSGQRRPINDIHGVRWCPHRNCTTRWNRDVNAARNMRQVFLYMLHNNQQRPRAFAHDGALSAPPPLAA